MTQSIAVDLDSVLNTLDQGWMARYNELYDDTLTPNDMTSWDTSTIVKPECGVKIFDILLEPGFFRGLGVQEGAPEAMAFLCEHFDVYIVSSCHPDVVADKVAWVNEHMPFFDTRKFVACHPKGIINTDFLIDDGPHNIEAFKQTTLVFDQPWNQQAEANYRIKSWTEIQLFFQQVLKEQTDEQSLSPS